MSHRRHSEGLQGWCEPKGRDEIEVGSKAGKGFNRSPKVRVFFWAV